jgi:3-dehydroquinate dehydratase I
MIRAIEVKGCRIGHGDPVICVPIIGRTEEELLSEARAVCRERADLVEWRADYYPHFDQPEKLGAMLGELRHILADRPILFTLRDRDEGGLCAVRGEEKVNLISGVIRSGLVDLVDIELQSGGESLNQVVAQARRGGVYVIISAHDFEKTLSREEMVQLLLRQQQQGADIAKIAMMPREPLDVLHLLEAAAIFYKEHARIPAVTVSMSQMGLISRIAGHVFGSAITFAAHSGQTSAPGQISAALTRQMMETLQPE